MKKHDRDRLFELAMRQADAVGRKLDADEAREDARDGRRAEAIEKREAGRRPTPMVEVFRELGIRV